MARCRMMNYIHYWTMDERSSIGPNIMHEIMIGEYCPISTPRNFKVEKWAINSCIKLVYSAKLKLYKTHHGRPSRCIA